MNTLRVFLLVAVMIPSLAQAQTPLLGWAWSNTIGWISLHCANSPSTCSTVNYGLEKQVDGSITGHAWSENIGWISAELPDVADCPVGLCRPYVSSSGLATGWLRALGNGGGWDGWIGLRDTWGGVEQDASGLTGFAWGSTVVGWVLFSADAPCALTAGTFCSGNALRYRDMQCTETVLIADCGADGCSPVTNQCVVPVPPMSVLPGGEIIKASPKIAPYGGNSLVSWSVINATSCSIRGNGNSWTSVSGANLTNPINESTTYTLTCLGPGGTLTGKVRITNPPRTREI
jgi:hypothetical protein